MRELLLLIFRISYCPIDGTLHAALEDCKKGLSRRAIEQLGYIKDVNSLVMLSGTFVRVLPSGL